MPESNFRDVGSTVNRILRQNLLVEKSLFRSGASYFIDSAPTQNVKNICLKQARLETSLARYAHVGISPDVDCYDIESATQSLWLHQVLEEVLSTPKNHSIHLFCHHGSDRTGVVVATILFLCNVPRDTIVKEYAESVIPPLLSAVRSRVMRLSPTSVSG